MQTWPVVGESVRVLSRAALCIFVVLSPSVVFAQTSAPPVLNDSTRTVRALRTTDSIRVDGHLTEEVWSRADVASGFIQVGPNPGAPSSERTEARVLYTDDALYVGMRMYDGASHRIAAQLARRRLVERRRPASAAG